MARSDPSQKPIRLRSEPGDPWFSTEIEAIATGLLTETAPVSDTEADYEMLLPSLRVHTLAIRGVRTVVQRGEPFTVEDLYRVVERGNVPMSQETTEANVETLLHRLERDDERFGDPAAAPDMGGDI